MEIARLERIILLKLLLLMVKVAVLKLPTVGVLELVEVTVLLQSSHDLGLERLLEERFQHGQIDLGMRHLMKNVVVPELRPLVFLALVVVPWLLGSFLALKPLALDGS